MVLITIVMGVYKPTYNWGPHIVSIIHQLVTCHSSPTERSLAGPHPFLDWRSLVCSCDLRTGATDHPDFATAYGLPGPPVGWIAFSG